MSARGENRKDGKGGFFCLNCQSQCKRLIHSYACTYECLVQFAFEDSNKYRFMRVYSEILSQSRFKAIDVIPKANCIKRGVNANGKRENDQEYWERVSDTLYPTPFLRESEFEYQNRVKLCNVYCQSHEICSFTVGSPSFKAMMLKRALWDSLNSNLIGVRDSEEKEVNARTDVKYFDSGGKILKRESHDEIGVEFSGNKMYGLSVSAVKKQRVQT